ncbi:hypothetical protein ABENE_11075 [Asticcacaulis benevestitus DSM 16100 = ATCC BAA-896]|uniref:HTH lysR-type domain-containing protein n=1 Tax=Asticcacaulis benevestitus DSM 16100 = ATCC BAA-896 TaxID=1121022 RepID=V4PZI8_9CAUL|nr:hypothetical protein ABENE_11075 [Asticcacaulis benevestitus DSM 16100 = ATCC BAA-896]
MTALRSFEAAGRLSSFTSAADELCVSQAAISRQIRDLEIELGQALFERRHRRVVLTPEGARLLTVLTQSFDDIDASLKILRNEQPLQVLRISVEPSFAACWLIPHLPDFQNDYPLVDIAVDSDPRLVEFRSQDVEIAIRYSRTHHAWPRTDSRLLAQVDMLPVIAPGLRDSGPELVTPGDLFNHVLLHEENRNAWTEWFMLAGLALPQTTRGPVLPDGGLVMQAAIRGQGIALLDKILVSDEIRTGGLVPAFELSVPNGAYYMVVRNFNRLTQPAQQFAQWLQDRFAANTGEPV